MKSFLDKNGNYITGEVRPALLSRLSPSLCFYPRMLRTVIMGSRAAKRGKYDDERFCSDSTDILESLEASGVRVEITGAGNFRDLEGPCVFIANHMSTLETFVLPSIILPFKKVTFIVKKSLVEYPVFGHIMRARNPITVGRENPREDLAAVLDGGAELLREGVSIIVFPQTTRSLTFEPKEFNTIGIKLARKADVPVVPVALKTDAWGNGKIFKDFGKIDPAKPVHIAFDEPLRITGRGVDEHARVVEFIRENQSRWQGTTE